MKHVDFSTIRFTVSAKFLKYICQGITYIISCILCRVRGWMRGWGCLARVPFTTRLSLRMKWFTAGSITFNPLLFFSLSFTFRSGWPRWGADGASVHQEADVPCGPPPPAGPPTPKPVSGKVSRSAHLRPLCTHCCTLPGQITSAAWEKGGAVISTFYIVHSLVWILSIFLTVWQIIITPEEMLNMRWIFKTFSTPFSILFVYLDNISWP